MRNSRPFFAEDCKVSGEPVIGTSFQGDPSALQSVVVKSAVSQNCDSRSETKRSVRSAQTVIEVPIQERVGNRLSYRSGCYDNLAYENERARNESPSCSSSKTSSDGSSSPSSSISYEGSWDRKTQTTGGTDTGISVNDSDASTSLVSVVSHGPKSSFQNKEFRQKDDLGNKSYQSGISKVNEANTELNFQKTNNSNSLGKNSCNTTDRRCSDVSTILPRSQSSSMSMAIDRGTRREYKRHLRQHLWIRQNLKAKRSPKSNDSGSLPSDSASSMSYSVISDSRSSLQPSEMYSHNNDEKNSTTKCVARNCTCCNTNTSSNKSKEVNVNNCDVQMKRYYSLRTRRDNYSSNDVWSDSNQIVQQPKMNERENVFCYNASSNYPSHSYITIDKHQPPCKPKHYNCSQPHSQQLCYHKSRDMPHQPHCSTSQEESQQPLASASREQAQDSDCSISVGKDQDSHCSSALGEEQSSHCSPTPLQYHCPTSRDKSCPPLRKAHQGSSPYQRRYKRARSAPGRKRPSSPFRVATAR